MADTGKSERPGESSRQGGRGESPDDRLPWDQAVGVPALLDRTGDLVRGRGLGHIVVGTVARPECSLFISAAADTLGPGALLSRLPCRRGHAVMLRHYANHIK